MSLKGFTLASGREKCCGWTIRCVVKEDGVFKTKGVIAVRSNEEAREQCKRYDENHKEEHCEYAREYNKEHKEERKEWKKNYVKTTKGKKVVKKAIAKVQAKRKRALCFEPLNEPFEGAHAHHVTKSVVIFIPEDLHRSVSHNIFTGKGMEEINKAAFEWLDSELIREAFDALEEGSTEKKPVGKKREEINWEQK